MQAAESEGKTEDARFARWSPPCLSRPVLNTSATAEEFHDIGQAARNDGHRAGVTLEVALVRTVSFCE